jgi:GpV Apex motif
VLFDQSQNITNVSDITTQGGIDLSGHVHGGVQTGGSNTTGPVG